MYLHSAAYDFCTKLANKGEKVPDIAFAGGFSSEDGVFKALALGAHMVSMALPFLKWANVSVDRIIEEVEGLRKELSVAMWFCGSKTIEDLKDHHKQIR